MAEIDRADSTAPRPGAAFHPLGPLVYRVASRRPARTRLVAGVVFAGCVAFLSVGAWFEPDPSGMGSHQQLGMPPCSMVMLVGYPCPTCGMTTAVAHAVRGELRSAFRAQPAGLAMALAVVVAAGVSLGVVVSGKVWALNWYRVSPARVVLGVLLLVLGGWIYKLVTGVVSGTLPLGR